MTSEANRPQVHAGIRYAGFWIRFAAYLIDFVVLEIAAMIVGFILGVVLTIAGVSRADIRTIAFWSGFAMGMLYGVGLLAGFGWTIGMRVLGLQVTDGRSFGRLAVGTAMKRFFASILSGLLFGYGYLIIGRHPEKRALHDRLAGTWVVYSKSIPGREAGYGDPVGHSHPAPMLSPDGRYQWDGIRWGPPREMPLPRPPAAPIVSPDGRYEWDGAGWRPL